MSNFVDAATLVIGNEFTFAAIVEGNKYSMRLDDGSYAGFELINAENNLVQIYDVVNGDYVPKCVVSFLAGRDIFCGLFPIGAIPDRSPTEEGCRFFRVDY